MKRSKLHDDQRPTASSQTAELPMFATVKATAREADPASSHDGAAQINREGHAKVQGARITEALAAIWPRGMTCDELDLQLFHGVHTAGKRMTMLEDALCVERTDERRITRGHVRAIVWRERRYGPE
jgi:hypothetical protein